jgi:hypothetical protein
MRTTSHASAWLLLFSALILDLRGEEVSGLVKRRETLDLGVRLLAPHVNPATSLPDNLVNPFSPQLRTVTKLADVPKSNGTDREILEKIAPSLAPSGMMLFGGKPMLLFREKKLKVGDEVKIPYEGVDYVVVITAIDRTSFRFSLNREEITRPIKLGKTP